MSDKVANGIFWVLIGASIIAVLIALCFRLETPPKRTIDILNLSDPISQTLLRESKVLP